MSARPSRISSRNTAIRESLQKWKDESKIEIFVKGDEAIINEARANPDTKAPMIQLKPGETPAMKQYVAGFPPAAVARDQLQYAKAELSTHDNQRVTKALNDGLQAALTGTKTPEQAMKDAQREADRLLRSYK